MSHRWPAGDYGEYEAACTEAWADGPGTQDRGRRFLEIVEDAAQAQRVWAVDLLRRFAERGAAAELKTWRKVSRKLRVRLHDGTVVDRPRVVGIARQDDGGRRYVEQTLFDLEPFEIIETKVREWGRQVRAYRANIALGLRLLALRDAAPAATTPAEAAAALGTTVAAWLLGDVA
jgi:hypothetical protein